eukprot:g8531.t1
MCTKFILAFRFTDADRERTREADEDGARGPCFAGEPDRFLGDGDLHEVAAVADVAVPKEIKSSLRTPLQTNAFATRFKLRLEDRSSALRRVCRQGLRLRLCVPGDAVASSRLQFLADKPNSNGLGDIFRLW